MSESQNAEGRREAKRVETAAAGPTRHTLNVQQVNVSSFYHLMARIYGIGLSVFDEAGRVTERHSSNPASVEFLLSVSALKERIFELCAKTNKPQVISSEFGQLWAGIPFAGKMMLIGPVFTSSGSTGIMLDYVRSYNISNIPREKLMEALTPSPVCSYTEFTRLIAILYAFIYDQELDTSEMSIAGLTPPESAPPVEPISEGERAITKENTLDPTYALGQHLLECIGEGNLEKLKRLLKTFNYATIHYLSLPDPIRQQKDMFIGLIAQVVSQAIRAGLNPEIAYSLYDRYIQRAETMSNMLPIITLTREMLYDYTRRVGSLKRTAQYSKLINDCCNYINAHVYENLRVTDIAAYSGRNAHYISQKFCEETGQSLSAYIRAAKIGEAQSLLKFSSLSLAEISERLAFSSQSFFTTTFRQVTGVTPGQFRENSAV